MLEASMDRRYSANPGEGFVTGGGLQVFHNFEPEDDFRIMSVREGFRNSVNLVFIRLMRDVVSYHLYRAPETIGRMVEDPADPRREAYLTRFADREGSEFIRQFYKKYQGKTAEESLDLLIGGIRPTPWRLATILRTANPSATVEDLRALLTARLPDVPLADEAVRALYDKYGPDSFSLMDRGYIARVHPLELWLLDYLRAHPGASLADTLGASADERQEVYRWLFKTSRKNAQDKRIAQPARDRGLPRDPARLGASWLSLRVAHAVAGQRGRRLRRPARGPRRADGHPRERRRALSNGDGGAHRLRARTRPTRRG